MNLTSLAEGVTSYPQACLRKKPGHLLRMAAVPIDPVTTRADGKNREISACQWFKAGKNGLFGNRLQQCIALQATNQRFFQGSDGKEGGRFPQLPDRVAGPDAAAENDLFPFQQIQITRQKNPWLVLSSLHNIGLRPSRLIKGIKPCHAQVTGQSADIPVHQQRQNPMEQAPVR
jgi:hypothetical protein